MYNAYIRARKRYTNYGPLQNGLSEVFNSLINVLYEGLFIKTNLINPINYFSEVPYKRNSMMRIISYGHDKHNLR